MTAHRDGLACGLSQWPEERFAAGPINALMDGTAPKLLPPLLKKCSETGVRLVCVFPRVRVTENGQTKGPYSPPKARALVDEYLRYISPEQLRQYADAQTLLGFSAGDDFTSTDAWGGKVVTPGQSLEVVAYAKERFGEGVPVGLRQTPSWISGSAELARVVDFGWAQWLGARGDPKVFYDKAWKIASRLGFKMAGGINVHSCVKAGTDNPCTVETLWRVGCIAQDHPGIRTFVCWRYDPRDWELLGPTWERLAERAATKPKRSLLRSAA